MGRSSFFLQSTVPLGKGWEGQVYREWNIPHEVIEQWDRIASQYGDKGIFINYGWFDCWWKAFGDGKSPFVVVLQKDGEIKAIFPLCTDGDHLSSMTNSHTCHYDFIVDTEIGDEAISYFIHVLQQCSSGKGVSFDYLDESSKNRQSIIQQLRRSRTPFHPYSQPWAPWMEISDIWSSFDNKLSSGMRNNLRRYLKRAESSGKVQLEIIKNTEKLDKILDVMFEIEFQSWKGDNGTAIKSQPEVEKFYRLLARWAMQNSHLQLFLLKIDDLPIAANYCLHYGQTVYQLKTGYLESYKKISPGKLIHYEIIKFLCESKCFVKYDLLGACDPWKMEWTSNSSRYGSIKVYPKSLGGWVAYSSKYGWKDLLKRSSMVRRAKNWLDSRREPKVAN